MASNREERRAQRARGAGRHEVQDVDFGSPVILGAPVAPMITRRVTRSSPPQPTTPAGATNDANTGAKRRRIDPGASEPPSSGTRSTRSRPTPRRDLFSLEDEPKDEPLEYTTGALTAAEAARETQIPAPRQTRRSPRGAVSNEGTQGAAVMAPTVDLPPSQAALAREERRAQRERGAGRRQVEAADFGTPFVPVTVAPVPPAAALPPPPPPPPPTRAITPTRANQSPRRSPVRTAPSPAIPRRRSPRQSVGDVTEAEIDQIMNDSIQRSLVEEQEEASTIVRPTAEEAEHIDDETAAAVLGRSRKRKADPTEDEPPESRSQEPAQEEEVPEEQEEQEQPEEEEPDEPSLIETRPTEQPRKRGRGRPPKDKGSPAVQRQPKPAKSKAKSKGSSALGIPRPKKSGVTIPVVVHRLTRPITYEETEEDADILNEKIPFAKRTGVNAVDVLAQFCDEIVDSALTALEEGGSTAEDAPTRREYNTKLKAVEAFGEELRTRLLELTIALDTDYHLTKRVRAALKQKLDLRKDLLAIRAQREQIALRMDEVRIKHEGSSKEAQDEAALNTAIHDIELAVPLGEDGMPEGGDGEMARPGILDAIRDVAQVASTRAPGGGILRRVREFNAFLEQAAGMLESRRE